MVQVPNWRDAAAVDRIGSNPVDLLYQYCT
jgi:hypothetical protein